MDQTGQFENGGHLWPVTAVNTTPNLQLFAEYLKQQEFP
jgi:hypothetical protein